jgi:hypothetical protein
VAASPLFSVHRRGPAQIGSLQERLGHGRV